MTTVADFLATLRTPHRLSGPDDLDTALHHVEDPDTAPFQDFLGVVQRLFPVTNNLRRQAEAFAFDNGLLAA